MNIKRGDTVTIKKGAKISQPTHPKQKQRTAKRTYSIKVDRPLPSHGICVGHRDFDVDGKKEYDGFNYYSKEDVRLVEELFGTSDITKLVDMDKVYERNTSTRKDGTSYCSLFIDLQGPQVCWAGTGGYWCYVDVKDLEEAS